jgi:hypothetical protein
MLEAAEFSGQPINEQQAFHIIVEGQALLGEAGFCALLSGVCAIF